MENDRAIGRPSDPIWKHFTKMEQLRTTAVAKSSKEGETTYTYARPRAKCNECGCIMTAQARQLKAHYAKCNKPEDRDDQVSSMHGIPAIKHQLSAAEKLLVVRCHAYFKEEKEKEKFLPCRTTPWQTRERVSKCLGISQKSVSQVVTEWNRFKDPTFQLKMPLPPQTDKPTPCRLTEFSTSIDTFIASRNAEQMDVTAQSVCAFLESHHGYAVDVAKVRRFLRKQGYTPGPRTNGRRYLVGPNSIDLSHT
ncbi:hypothetical protein LEN26_010675 [Aphanomyces euteiches]|nr:hypothetical protein AeMF1_011629 [Aphanomyces euteiches]KAH9121449.1 hypothetical protein LEN26_010675 [Aphanomyces euteiches]KAH9186786.1 hypothetical protein AeNC1_011236 [Aphanomyces euteiches]